jgi:hypothetical protein
MLDRTSIILFRGGIVLSEMDCGTRLCAKIPDRIEDSWYGFGPEVVSRHDLGSHQSLPLSCVYSRPDPLLTWHPRPLKIDVQSQCMSRIQFVDGITYRSCSPSTIFRYNSSCAYKQHIQHITFHVRTRIPGLFTAKGWHTCSKFVPLALPRSLAEKCSPARPESQDTPPRYFIGGLEILTRTRRPFISLLSYISQTFWASFALSKVMIASQPESLAFFGLYDVNLRP